MVITKECYDASEASEKVWVNNVWKWAVEFSTRKPKYV